MRRNISNVHRTMATVNFGFGINKPRVIDLDRNNLRKSDEILREMPELAT